MNAARMGDVGCVGVVGAGIAGLACAVAAANAGAAVDVYEGSAGPACVAAHVVVGPGMLRDLVTLGLGDACVHAGFPYQGTAVFDGAGHAQYVIEAERLAGPQHPAQLGISHEALTRLLLEAAAASGVRIYWNTAVRAMQAEGPAAALTLADGRRAAADLLLLASGAASELRTPLFPQPMARMHFAQQWWYVLVERPTSLECASVVFANAGQKAMLVPLGARSAGLAITVPAAPGHGLSVLPHARDLRAAAHTFPALVRDAAARVSDHATVVVRPVVGELLPAPWHHGPFLCVGACAHALPPQFGQAAAQAMEDAVVLQDLLRQPLAATELAARFTARRAPRARRVFDTTIQAARWDVAPDGATDLRSLSEQLARTLAVPA